MQSSLGNSAALLISRVTKTLEVGRGSTKSLSVGAKKAKKPREASGSKSLKVSSKGSSSCNNNTDINSVRSKGL